MTSPFISGPNAAYRNVPVEPQYYKPRAFEIIDIARGSTTLVYVSPNHNYVVGQLVRFLIPYPWGMIQLNEQLGYVINIPLPDTFIIDLNSTQFDPFIVSPVNPGRTLPQVVAVGDNNTGIISQTGRVVHTTGIPGAFINISPI